ncbi:MAG: hypothetical protein KGJ46_10420, partial [Xanthomonadaceae bacterium]|nr:hypothetical protein [Xanthomonadaceae bacterium]
TYVHRRLLPALVRAAAHFKPEQLVKLREEHTVSGKHVTHETAYPGWVPEETRVAARKLTESEALEQLHRCASA